MARKIPQDPLVRNLVNLMQNTQLDRRSLFRTGAASAAGAGALALSACAPGGSAESVAAGDGSAGSIVWGNWPYYLDYDDAIGSYPTLNEFMAATNIDVEFIEDIDDNNTFYGKIKDQLALGQHTGYDTVTCTDWINARMIQDGQVQEFNRASMPNTKNILPSLLNSLDVDPGRKFTIPWQAPVAGFVWNTELVPGGIRTLDDFLQPDLKGKVGVLTEMRDTMGIIMLAQGVDVAGSWDDTAFENALAWLDEAIKGGYITQVKGNSYTQDLESETTLAAIAWTGDVATLNAEQGDQWTLEIPESGGMITADSFTVPNGTSAEEKALVEELINYYYNPEVAAQVADYVWFVTPVAGAQEAMELVNPEQVNNPMIFPDEEMNSRLFGFRTLTPQEDKKYTDAFQKVLGL